MVLLFPALWGVTLAATTNQPATRANAPCKTGQTRRGKCIYAIRQHKNRFKDRAKASANTLQHKHSAPSSLPIFTAQVENADSQKSRSKHKAPALGRTRTCRTAAGHPGKSDGENGPHGKHLQDLMQGMQVREKLKHHTKRWKTGKDEDVLLANLGTCCELQTPWHSQPPQDTQTCVTHL